MEEPISYDLGSGYSYTKFSWSPDRELNPQYDDCPDVEWCGILLKCPHGEGGVRFIIPGHRLFQNGWKVENWDSLTLSPSILRRECECHGFIRNGKWVGA